MTTEPVRKHGPDTETKLWMSRTDQDLKQAKDAYRQLRKTVYGNGEPGLDEKVRKNSADIETLMREIREFHLWLRRMLVKSLWWFVSGAGAILAAVAIWAIKGGAL